MNHQDNFLKILGCIFTSNIKIFFDKTFYMVRIRYYLIPVCSSVYQVQIL